MKGVVSGSFVEAYDIAELRTLSNGIFKTYLFSKALFFSDLGVLSGFALSIEGRLSDFLLPEFGRSEGLLLAGSFFLASREVIDEILTTC